MSKFDQICALKFKLDEIIKSGKKSLAKQIFDTLIREEEKYDINSYDFEEVMCKIMGTLSKCYYFGLGVEKDLDKSRKYLRKAIELGDATISSDIEDLENY